MNGLLTVEQVAQKLNLSTFTIKAYLRKGKLKGVKVSGSPGTSGGRWGILPAALDAYIEAGEEQRETHIKNISDCSVQAASPASTSSKAVIGAGGEQRETRIHKCKSSAQAAPPAPTSKEVE